MKAIKIVLRAVCLICLALCFSSCENTETNSVNKKPVSYAKTSDGGALVATFSESDGYEVIRSPNSLGIFNLGEYIAKDGKWLYTMENGELKKLERTIEKHTNDITLRYDAHEFTLTYTWYELNGNYYVEYERDIQNGYQVVMYCRDGKHAIIDLQGEYKEHVFLCEPSTGKVTDPFAEIGEQYNISIVNLSSDGKKAFLHCYKGKPHDLYGPILSSSSTAQFGKTTSFYFYFDGMDVTEISELCGFELDNTGAYCYFIDDKLMVLTSNSSGNDNKDYIYSYDVNTETVKKIVDGLSNEKDHFTTHERYGSYRKDDKLYIIDYLTEKTAAANIEFEYFYDMYYIGSKYILVTYKNGKRVLIESATGNVAGTANARIDESGQNGYVFDASDGNIYLAVCDYPKTSIYCMGKE